MSHPFAGHKENAVGHRRAKLLMRGGAAVAKRADGGSVEELKAALCSEPDADEMPVAEGAKRGGRLDKRARGGKVEKFANGGAIHKITPSKRKPHVMININNSPRPRGGGMLAIKPPMPMGAGALPGIRPPGMATGGKIGKMRTGNKYGQGSGTSRLEEFKHMKGK